MIRYSGSILRYSISEAAHAKSVTIVDLDENGACTVEVVPVTQPAGMVRLRGELDDLVSGAYSQHRDDFVDILLTDRRLPDNYLAQLHDAFTRILSALPHRSARLDGDGERAAASPLQATSQLDTLRNFYVTARGEEPTAQMDRILTDVLERARQSVEV
jgi:exonuclease SbcD